MRLAGVPNLILVSYTFTVKSIPCDKCGSPNQGTVQQVPTYGSRIAIDCKKCGRWFRHLGRLEWNGMPDKEDQIHSVKDGATVYNRDLLQPLEGGKPNQKFLDRYGDGLLKGEYSQLNGEGKQR